MKINKNNGVEVYSFFHFDNNSISENDFEVFIDYKKVDDVKISNNYLSWNFPKEGIYSIIILFKKKLKSCSEMFLNCDEIIKINLSNFDCSEIFSCKKMFYRCTSLRKINLGVLDFSLSTSFENMFFGCENLINLDVSNFDTRNSITFESMFEGCSKLNEINVSNFNSSKCEKICCMFSECKSITKINILNWDMCKIKIDNNNKKDINNNSNNSYVGIYKLFYICTNLCEIKMNLNFKSLKKLYTYKSFENISEKGTFIYNEVEGSEDFLNLLPKKWIKSKNFNYYDIY